MFFVRLASYVTLFLMRHFSAPIFELQRASLSFFFSFANPPTHISCITADKPCIQQLWEVTFSYALHVCFLCLIANFLLSIAKIKFFRPKLLLGFFFKVKSVNLISNSELNNRQVLHGNCVIGSFDFHSCCFPIFKQRPDSHPV